MAKDTKTNAMRKLDSMKIPYREHYYTDTEALSGVEVAAAKIPHRFSRHWSRLLNQALTMSF